MKDEKQQNVSRAHGELTDAKLAELIAEATNRPGVQEVMRVYESWRRLQEAARPSQQAIAPKWLITCSNNSVP